MAEWFKATVLKTVERRKPSVSSNLTFSTQTTSWFPSGQRGWSVKPVALPSKVQILPNSPNKGTHMKTDDLVIYKDVPVRIIHKCWHVHKVCGKCHRDFTKDFGDVPVTRVNPETGNWEEVVNNRGLAYATRNRLMYKSNAKVTEKD